MIITAQQAKPYFANSPGLVDDPEDWMHYRADSGVCGAFHQHLWPGIWMGHVGVLPEALGKADAAVLRILTAFAEDRSAERIIGWVKESNRAALAMFRRVGFETDGRLPLAEPVILLGWRP